MEPTIYKPSIYNGAGIYKNGAEGGGDINLDLIWNGVLDTIGQYIDINLDEYKIIILCVQEYNNNTQEYYKYENVYLKDSFSDGNNIGVSNDVVYIWFNVSNNKNRLTLISKAPGYNPKLTAIYGLK